MTNSNGKSQTITSEQLAKWDDEYVWHPFTPHSVYRDEIPLTIVEGDGHYLIDADGHRYFDAVGSIWCNLFGHRRKEIDDAIRDQLDRIAHATLLGNSNDKAILLAKRLVELAPEGLDKVFFSDNGSTSVEIALKMAVQFWQQTEDGKKSKKQKFFALANGYSGDTVGAVSVGGVDLFHTRFRSLIFDVVRGPSPYFYRRPEGQSLQEAEEIFMHEVERLLREHADELAAVVIEPGMQAAGGMITYPKGFLKQLRQWTTELDILLICDEVAMGMGRSGKMFVCEREEIVPDFLCIAKGLTGGYLPLAATLTTNRVYEAFLGPPELGRTFFHGHTYTGNALGAAAALATLDIFENDEIFLDLPDKMELFETRLGSLCEVPGVGDIRHYGMAAGVEVVACEKTKKPIDPVHRVGMRVARQVRIQGVFIRPLGDIIVFMPPLSILPGEIDVMIAAVKEELFNILPDYSVNGPRKKRAWYE